MQITKKDVFLNIGLSIVTRNKEISDSSKLSTYHALSGTTPHITKLIWNEIYQKCPKSSSPKHLLWALQFLKTYSTEAVHCSITKSDPKAFRKWKWLFVRRIAGMKIVGFIDYAS